MHETRAEKESQTFTTAASALESMKVEHPHSITGPNNKHIRLRNAGKDPEENIPSMSRCFTHIRKKGITLCCSAIQPLRCASGDHFPLLIFSVSISNTIQHHPTPFSDGGLKVSSARNTQSQIPLSKTPREPFEGVSRNDWDEPAFAPRRRELFLTNRIRKQLAAPKSRAPLNSTCISNPYPNRAELRWA